ncbi:isopentenyl-diphosphate Delta-isomerase [Leucobacter zeae]|nr:isopentenyl-diphosphate Delta-isomerase [Leucobacter zeae]
MRTHPEMVVLLTPEGAPCGTAAKADVHTEATPFHLAFSCYLVDSTGRLLVTRRALAKRTWPGVWTNSFCGHPAPGETGADAVVRRAREELGARVVDVTCVLPDFTYRAVDASGIVEHELCPVYIARLEGELLPEPSEISEWAWIDPGPLQGALSDAPFAFSPWIREQLPRLTAAGAWDRRGAA